MSEWDCEHGRSHDLCPVCNEPSKVRVRELEFALKALLEIIRINAPNTFENSGPCVRARYLLRLP